MISINIKEKAGTFAENKDVAGELREIIILPELGKAHEITIDFTGVDGATQSFVHALISEALRQFGSEVVDHIIFKGCNDSIQQIVNIVIDYMQES